MAWEFVPGSSEYVDIGSGSHLDLGGDVSVCFWVRFDDVTTTRGICGQANGIGGGGQWNLSVGSTDNEIGLGWNGVGIDTSTSNFQTGTWYHFAFTKTGSSFDWDTVMFTDGATDETHNEPSTNPASQTATSIGRLGVYDAIYYDGRLFDVRIYDRQLSATEIKIIYEQKGNDNIVNGLVGRYLFMELPQGNNAHDVSPQSNTGTYSGTPVYQESPKSALTKPL